MAKVAAQVLGGDLKELNDVTTVADVKAKLNATNHTATVNGDTVDDDYELSDSEWVTLSPSVKGALI